MENNNDDTPMVDDLIENLFDDDNLEDGSTNEAPTINDTINTTDQTENHNSNNNKSRRNDVLLGRGLGGIIHHGNQAFRTLVKKKRVMKPK